MGVIERVTKWHLYRPASISLVMVSIVYFGYIQFINPRGTVRNPINI